jgi:hypothetical protein
MNKKVFFALIVMSYNLIAASNVSNDDQYFQSWKSSYLDHMSLTEKQTIANIIYLLLANSVAESKIRQFSTPIARLNQTIRTKIEHYENATEDIAMLKTLVERLSFVVNTRTIYNETLKTAINHYNKNTSSMIDSALASLQLYAQEKLRNWANERITETSKILKKSSDNVGDTVQHFQGVSNLHKAMSEGTLPMEIQPEDESNKSLLILSIILNNNAELLGITDTVINSLNETTDHAAQIIETGLEIYRNFYIVLYDILMASDRNKQYATTLFGMHDVLPDEYKSALPDVDHVFEHMLQTVKLYTRTEFIQS